MVAAREQDGKRGLRPGNPAPRREKRPLLQAGLGRRVIGGDDVHASVQQLGPQPRLLVGGPERGRALGDNSQALDVLLGEAEIVRTRLDRHVDATRHGLCSDRHALPRADVHQVQADAGLRREGQRAPNGVELGGDRPRSQEASRCAVGHWLEERAALGVDRHRQPEPRGFAHARFERAFVGRRKFRQTRIAHERLEANDAQRRHRGHLRDGAGDEAAPQCKVRDGRGLERRAFAVDGLRGHRAGRGVERHVHEDRPAAGRQRAAAGRGAFPLRSAWFIEMHVDVDSAREHEPATGVDFLARPGELPADLDDPSSLDRQIRVDYPLGSHESAAPNYEVDHDRLRARSSKNSRPALSAAATSASTTCSSG